MDRKKIGVMTFWETKNNYGQILQVYALQKTLLGLGHDPYVIRYKRISIRPKKTLLKKAAQLISFLFDYKKGFQVFGDKLEKRFDTRKFDKFRSDHIVFGQKTYNSLEELKNVPPEAQVYIAGSDQVWNNSFSVSCEAFLLGFGAPEIKKVAYAASFGQRSLDDKTHRLFKNGISSFDSIGVREASGVGICERLERLDAVHVPDPTIILGVDKWKELSKRGTTSFKTEKQRFFVYTLGDSKILDQKKDYLKYASRVGETIHVSSNGDFTGNTSSSVYDWLGAISTCDFVITTSFHCVVFSLLFNKNFIVLPNTGDRAGMNERIISLLSKFDMVNHIVKEFNSDLIDKIGAEVIDWDSINVELSNWKEQGISFLKDSIK